MNDYTSTPKRNNCIKLSEDNPGIINPSPEDYLPEGSKPDLACEKFNFPSVYTLSRLILNIGNTRIGIDTAHLKFPIEISDDLLISPWKRRTLEREDKSLKIWYTRRHYINGAKIFMKYFPMDYDGKPLLVIEISSITRLLYTDNTIPINDMEEAIDTLNEIFGLLLPGLQIDIGDGILERVDFFYDHFTGDQLYFYLEAISQLSHRNWHRELFTNRSKHFKDRCNGVGFWCTDRDWVFYNKELECGKYGLLRQESRMRDTDAITRAIGLSRPTLRGITPEIVYSVLRRDLEQLGLWGTSISGGNLALALLKVAYPKGGKAQRLYRILEVIQDNRMKDKKEIALELGIGVQQYNRSIADIEVAGVTPGFIDQEIVLPPLTLPGAEEEANCKIIPKDASDTEIDNSLVTQDEIRLLKGVIE
jgi:hypothetical protein